MSTSPDRSSKTVGPHALALLCPHCGSSFSAQLEYTTQSYSEHRDHVGYECDEWSCGAEWDRFGAVRVASRLLPESSR